MDARTSPAGPIIRGGFFILIDQTVKTPEHYTYIDLREVIDDDYHGKVYKTSKSYMSERYDGNQQRSIMLVEQALVFS